MVSLFVAPESQRRGIDTLLVDDALDTCRLHSPKGLVALNSSAFASDFYMGYGFKPNGNPVNLPGGCIPYVHHF